MIPENLWADDLSGAAEIAHLLAHRTGRPVQVVLRAQDVQGGGLCVRDLDLRHLSADDARAAVAAELGRLGSDARVFLKIDSQLHGPVGGYLGAFAASGRTVLLSAANPALGRVTLDGRHHVPTGGGADVTDLAALLDGVPHRHLPVAGAVALSVGRPGVLSVDARTAADLAAIAQRAADLDVAGSAAVLDALLGGHGGSAAPDEAPTTAPPEHLLAVVGSTEPMARRQVAAAHARGIRVIAVDDGVDAPAIADALRRGPLVLTRSAADTTTLRALAARAAAALGEIEPTTTAVLLTGGHTARLVLDRLDIAVVTAAPTEPSAIARLMAPSGLTVLTKPGSYGDPDALLTFLRPAEKQHTR